MLPLVGGDVPDHRDVRPAGAGGSGAGQQRERAAVPGAAQHRRQRGDFPGSGLQGEGRNPGSITATACLRSRGRWRWGRGPPRSNFPLRTGRWRCERGGSGLLVDQAPGMRPRRIPCVPWRCHRRARETRWGDGASPRSESRLRARPRHRTRSVTVRGSRRGPSRCAARSHPLSHREPR